MASILGSQVSSQQAGVLITLGVIIFLGGVTLLGLVFLLTGIRGALKLWRLKQRGLVTVGQVIDVKQQLWRSRPNQRGRGKWGFKLPVVRFYASNGGWVTFTSMHLERYTPGNQVQVRFLPENPEVAELVETTIFSGYNPTIFARLAYGVFAFPCGGFLLLQVLPRATEALAALQ